MFEYVRGRLESKSPSHCVIDVGGVAYRVEIPLSTYRSLPEQGAVAQVWTSGRISEEELVLYGFSSREERDLFATMTATVPNLGPRRALAVLSSMGPKELLDCVHKGEVARLRNTKGIGDKLASRMILELRGKLPQGNQDSASSVFHEAILALVSLGFARQEAEAAVARASRASDPNAPLEELIKRSLEHV